jgi:hypothetical protein
MKSRRDETKKGSQPRDFATQFRELEILRAAVAKAEAQILKEVTQKKNGAPQKRRQAKWE